jgi:hypothetical protein
MPSSWCGAIPSPSGKDASERLRGGGLTNRGGYLDTLLQIFTTPHCDARIVSKILKGLKGTLQTACALVKFEARGLDVVFMLDEDSGKYDERGAENYPGDQLSAFRIFLFQGTHDNKLRTTS